MNVDSKGFGEWMWMGTFLSPVWWPVVLIAIKHIQLKMNLKKLKI
jgi:hypothetical protein